MRDDEVAVHGYEVMSLRPAQRYLEEVKRLVERVDQIMKEAENDRWKVALKLRVTRTAPDEEEDVPF